MRTSPSPAPTQNRWRQTFAGLQHRNYRVWFCGQLVSLFGTWMQVTAQGFLVYQLTRSARYLGFVGFAAGVPTWAFTLYGGVVADRFSRRSLMVVTQSVMMALAFILAALTFLDVVQPWHILVLALLLGTANAFDAPARQALASDLVPREDLTNAIALNSMMFNAATVVGPAVAGVAYAMFGPGWCFTINGLSFIAVIVALRLIKLDSRAPARRVGGSFAQLSEGIRYVLGEPVVRTAIGVVAVTSLFALSMATLVPAWAVNVLHGGATVNGLLLSARGIGSLAGALLLASLGRTAARGRLLTVGSLVYPVLLFGFAIFDSLPASLLMLAGVGVGTLFVLNLANAIVQTSAPDELRGRVMGAYTWIFFGCMPLGALWIGTTAEHLGEPRAVMINAGLAMFFALAVALFFPKLRRV
jgi:MFS family permease